MSELVIGTHRHTIVQYGVQFEIPTAGERAVRDAVKDRSGFEFNNCFCDLLSFVLRPPRLHSAVSRELLSDCCENVWTLLTVLCDVFAHAGSLLRAVLLETNLLP